MIYTLQITIRDNDDFYLSPNTLEHNPIEVRTLTDFQLENPSINELASVVSFFNTQTNILLDQLLAKRQPEPPEEQENT